MALILKDGELLVSDGALATSTDCCCNVPCNKCDYSCANSAELEMTGWQNYDCPEITNGDGSLQKNDYYYGTALNDTFSTTDLTLGNGSILPCVHYGSLAGSFHLGVRGSSDRGRLIARLVSTYTDFVSTWEYYAYLIEAGAGCSPPQSGFDGGLCRIGYFSSPLSGTVRVYTQLYINNVWSAFSQPGPMYVYKNSVASSCVEVPDLYDDIAPSEACNIEVPSAVLSPGEISTGCPGFGSPSFYALDASGTSIFTGIG